MMTLHWAGGGIPKMEAAVIRLRREPKLHKALRRALNHTGERAFTRVKRAVARQSGLTQRVTAEKGRLRWRRANYSDLSFEIRSSGRHISLRYFKPHQFKAGTKASPWGERRLFEHAFMGPRPGVVAIKLRGHVFVRVAGAGRLPIRRLWGPAIPRELVRDESAAAFQAVVSERLPKRLAHEIRVLTRGVVS